MKKSATYQRCHVTTTTTGCDPYRIGTEIFEEAENEDIVLAGHEKSNDYYHDFRNRDDSAFIFGHEVCTYWTFNEMFIITK